MIVLMQDTTRADIAKLFIIFNCTLKKVEFHIKIYINRQISPIRNAKNNMSRRDIYHKEVVFNDIEKSRFKAAVPL